MALLFISLTKIELRQSGFDHPFELEDRDDILLMLEGGSLKKRLNKSSAIFHVSFLTGKSRRMCLRCVALRSGKQLIIASERKKYLVAMQRDEAIFILRSGDCFSVICNMLQEKNDVRVNTNFSYQFDTLRWYDMNERSQMQGGKN